MSVSPPDRYFISAALPVLAVLALATSVVQAGTWTNTKWTGDADLPKASPDSVTHAVAFGIETEPSPPTPFEITKRISGDNWSVWTYPEHAASVEVTRRGEQMLDAVKVGGSGAALVRGRIVPKGKNKGLSLELTGLEPGKKYRLVVFGPQILGPSGTSGGPKIKATASDAPDTPEILATMVNDGKYFAYDYTAPEDGGLKVDFESGNTEHAIGVIRFCAFLNFALP